MPSAYPMRIKIRVCLVFKFYLINCVLLACSAIHLIQVMSNTKKKLYKEVQDANQMLSRWYISSSNVPAFIEDIGN